MCRPSFRLLLVLPALLLAACYPPAQGVFGKSEELPYRFFRVEADFEVRATGELIRFDYIAWCGGSVTHWSSGSPSIRYDIFPQMMFQPTEDGAAIGIRTFHMCHPWGWEKDSEGNSRIPDDLLPMVQWYPDVDDMIFAIGYESEAAYESPCSKLNFLGAKLSQTDAETWASWRSAYEASFTPVGGIENPYYDINMPNRIRRSCNAASRVPIPPERAAEAEALVPEGVGRFWPQATASRTESEERSKAAFRQLLRLDPWRYGGHFDGRRIHAYQRVGPALGAMTRAGGGRVKDIRNTAATHSAYADIFPVIMSLAEEPDKKNGQQGIIDLHIPTSDEWNGFSFCGIRFIPQETLEGYLRGDLPKEALSLPHIHDFEWRDDGDPTTRGATVKQQTVFRAFIGDELVSDNAIRWSWAYWVYDRTGFMYILSDN